MDNKRIIVLGCGMVGSAMAKDLSKDHLVSCADISKNALNQLAGNNINCIEADLSDSHKIKNLVSDYDLVIGAVPGSMGFQTARAVIEAGKNMVDISFFEEDAFELDTLAKKHQVCLITDCGVAPGMSNIIAGFHAKNMDVHDFKCYVGGLPKIRKWPYEYKAVFSPRDVIEEYIRPARFVVNGKTVVKEALSEPELLHFNKPGSLEAFNSDGLRTMIKTLNIPNMIEKTMRYPGSMDAIRVMKHSGFLSEKEVLVGNKKIRPLDLTAKLLTSDWKFEEGEEDITVMKIIVRGTEEGRAACYEYDLYDEYDSDTGIASMSRTTGYTATAVANLVLEGAYFKAGVNPPEYIGETEENLGYILQYLKERNISYKISKK